MTLVPSGRRRGCSVIDRAAPRDQPVDVPLAPVATSAGARSSIEAGKGRVDCQSPDLEPGFPREEVLKPAEADQVAEQTPDIVVRAVGRVEADLAVMHLDAEVAETGPAVKAFAIRGRFVDRDVVLKRAALTKLERSPILAV